MWCLRIRRALYVVLRLPRRVKDEPFDTLIDTFTDSGRRSGTDAHATRWVLCPVRRQLIRALGPMDKGGLSVSN